MREGGAANARQADHAAPSSSDVRHIPARVGTCLRRRGLMPSHGGAAPHFCPPPPDTFCRVAACVLTPHLLPPRVSHPVHLFPSARARSLDLYSTLFCPNSPPLLFFPPLIAKSMPKVREQGVAGTASELGYTLPPLPRNLCMRVCAPALASTFFFPPSPHTCAHPSICPISTCAEAQPPGKLSNESLPEPSVAFLVAVSSLNSPLPTAAPIFCTTLPRHLSSPTCIQWHFVAHRFI